MADFIEYQGDVSQRVRRGASDREAVARSGRHALGLAATLGNARVGQVLRTPGVQRAGATSAQQLDESVARAIEERRGRGRPLEVDVRSNMEAALGRDLADVRVHTDSTAHQLNEAVSARAFTTGRDVFFKQGAYDPSSSSGRELLGHELTHVVQQREGTSGLQAGEVSHPTDSAEQDAATVGKHLADTPAPISGGHGTASTGVARDAAPDDELEEPVAGAWDLSASAAREADEEPEETS